MRCLASKKNIQNLLYATLFLLPLHLCVLRDTSPILLLWAVNHCTTGEVKCVRPRLWDCRRSFWRVPFSPALALPTCLFTHELGLPAIDVCRDLPFDPSLLSSVREKEKALYAFLAGAICVAAYGFIQYANVAGMAA